MKMLLLITLWQFLTISIPAWSWSTFRSTTIGTYIAGLLQDLILEVLKTGHVPKHVAFIMDGNRRYAKNKGLPLAKGHSAGAESLVSVLETAFRVGITHCTIYAFSIENFNRTQAEVDTLLGLLRDRLKLLAQYNASKLDKQFMSCSVRIIGNKSMIPEDILKDLEEIEESTAKSQTGNILNVCFPYTSRDDITHSIKCNIESMLSGDLDSQSISLQSLTDFMYMGRDSPPLDILIRTSGHNRLSDFMLWQANKSCTIEFINILWPQFKFLQFIFVLFKWSYYKTIQLEAESVPKIKKSTSKSILLNDLPPHPPYVVVGQGENIK